MLKVKIILSVILLICISLLNAQDSHFINFNTKDGLPSREVYDVEVDEAGLIWLTTDRGICTYDGYNFKIYTTQDGLADNVNFEIFRDSKERLWFNGYGGGVTIFENGKFKQLKRNDQLINILDGLWASDILESEDGSFYAARLRINEGETKLIRINQDESPYTLNEGQIDTFFNIIKTENTELITFGKYSLSMNLISESQAHHLPNIAHKSGNYWYYFIGNIVYKYDEISKTKIQYDFDNRIGSLYLDKSDIFWVCTEKGLYCFPDGQLDKKPQHYLKNENITNIAEDKEGAYWVTCTQNGVYYLSSLDIATLNLDEFEIPNKAFFTIATLDQHILFGGKDSKVLILDSIGNIKIFSMPDFPADVRYISINENEASTYNYRFSEEKGNLSYREEDNSFKGIIKKLANGHSFRVTSRGFLVYDKNDNLIHKSLYSKKPFGSVITTVIESGNTIWLGTLKGLYKISNYEYLNVEPILIDGKGIFGRVNHIHEATDNNLWIASIGNGLFFLNKDKVFTLKKKDGLSSDMINRILLMNDSTLCLATNKGVNVLNFNYMKDSLVFSNIKSFTISDGLISNFINDIKYWKSEIWLATDNGICHFNPDYFKKKFAEIPVTIDKVIVNDSICDVGKKLVLKHDENDLQINYLGISFKKENEESFYRFRLQSEEELSNWFYTNEKSIRYNNMSPGNYTFEVAAKNKSNDWTSKPAKIAFEIRPHFINTLWFQILAFALVISTLGVLIYSQIKRLKLREYEKRKLQEAELNALRNQMNPHFVFNSLNSIQSFIFKNDIEKANHYLSKFSRLMRDSLQYTRLDFISLREEVDFIKNYLDLEAMRFSGKFEFQINIQETLDLEFITIPSLLLQPVLENSIKHAFNKISYLGLLTVDIIDKSESSLEVIIQDNGLGIDSLTKKKPKAKPSYKSLGLEIIKNRIELLNSKDSKDIASIRIKNISDLDKEKTGLLVHFILPIKYIQ